MNDGNSDRSHRYREPIADRRSPIAVWAFLAVPENQMKCRDEVLEVEQVEGMTLADGARFRYRLKVDPRAITVMEDVTECLPGERFRIRPSGGLTSTGCGPAEHSASSCRLSPGCG